MIKYCQNCGERPGNFVVKTTIAGQERDLCLCEVCAQKMGLTATEKNEYEGLLFARATEKECPNCGMRESEFEETGKAGCSVCYYVFGQAKKICQEWHGSARHTGKVADSNVLSKTRLGTLMIRLRNASIQGNMEQVRQIKNELKVLEAANAKK